MKNDQILSKKGEIIVSQGSIESTMGCVLSKKTYPKSNFDPGNWREHKIIEKRKKMLESNPYSLVYQVSRDVNGKEIKLNEDELAEILDNVKAIETEESKNSQDEEGDKQVFPGKPTLDTTPHEVREREYSDSKNSLHGDRPSID